MRACVLFLILSTAAALPVSAQSLADVARKEGERRQTSKGAGKTYTDKDLKPVPAPSADAAPADKAADDAKAADAATDDKAPADKKTDDKSSKAADSKTVKDEAYWSSRMAALHEQLDRDETFLSALQNRIDSLTTDFVNRDDPAQQSQIRADRDKALAELDRLKKVVEQDRRAIPELEEEARREGVPAGWLR